MRSRATCYLGQSRQVRETDGSDRDSSDTTGRGLGPSRLGKEEVAAKMQRPLLIDLVRKEKVAYGKAAEQLSISQTEFLAHLAKHKISPFQVTP